MSLLKQIGLAILAGLMALAGVFKVQRDRARDRADTQQHRADTQQARMDQRREADEADDEAKGAGDAKVDNVRDEARAGRRDHFSRGMSDD